MTPMKCGGKDCIYRTGAGEPGVSGKNEVTCNYAFITGKTRLKQVYDKYGISRYDRRAARILGRIKCPFYSRGDRIRKNRPELALSGTGRREKYDWVRGRALYEGGASDSEIVKELGCSYAAVKGWRGKRGLRANPAPKALSKINWALARELYGQGATDRKIAEAVGCSYTSVYDWRRREGLPVRAAKKKIDWTRGRELYEKGMSDMKIARALGAASTSSVRHWREREGLPANTYSGRPGKEKSEIQI